MMGGTMVGGIIMVVGGTMAAGMMGIGIMDIVVRKTQGKGCSI